MASDLNGQTIAFLVADEGVEEVEMVEPWKAVENAAGTPELVSPKGGKVQAFNHLDKSKTYDLTFNTNCGSFVVELFDDTPISRTQFLNNVIKGKYEFERVS